MQRQPVFESPRRDQRTSGVSWRPSDTQPVPPNFASTPQRPMTANAAMFPSQDPFNSMTAELQRTACERDYWAQECERLRQESAASMPGAPFSPNAVTRQSANSSFVSSRDVPDNVLPVFDPDNRSGLRPMQWLEKVERIASTYEWPSPLLLARAVSRLSGPAADWYESTSLPLSTWEQFRSALLRAFPVKIDLPRIHAELASKKRHSDQSYTAYVYSMAAIGRRGQMDETTIIQYIIKGLEQRVRIPLATLAVGTIEDLLQALGNLELAETVADSTPPPPNRHDKSASPPRERRTSSSSQPPTHQTRKSSSNGSESGRGLSENRRGPRCYGCNRYGHRKADCRSRQSQPAARINYVRTVGVNGRSCSALFDTGSGRNLISADAALRIHAPIRQQENTLQGFAGDPVRCEEIAELKINIEGQGYQEPAVIVPPDSIDVDLLLGREFLDKIVYRSDYGKIKVLQGETLGDASAIVKKETASEIPASTEPVIETEGRDVARTEIDAIMRINSETENNDAVPELESEAISGLTTPQVIAVKNLIKNYVPSCTQNTSTITKIELTDAIPVAQHPRRLAPAESAAVDKQVREWLASDIIRPSKSPYCSPIVLVKKKDGSLRMCIDYRRLNTKVIRDRFPLPQLDEQLDKLQKAAVFSTIDLRNGFLHVPVEEQSKQYTAFATPSGQYEFNRTPFGYVNSPAAFARFVAEIFQPLVDEGIVATYLDDIIVLAADKDEALQRLERVLQRAADHGLQINWKKCQFLQRRVQFLGYEIEESRIHPNPEKIRAVQGFPQPRNVKQLQRFLGLTGYFRRFIRDYARMAKPLTNLLRKETMYEFGVEQREAFEKLKQSLCERPVLAIYNPNAVETQLHTDACQLGLAAILMQRSEGEDHLHPVHYYGKTTTPPQRNYSSYELEVLAIVTALKKFRVYLLGINFTIVTDCSAFQQTMAKKELSTRVARWALALEDYDYRIEHRPGTAMKHADALSRVNVMLTEDALLFKIRRAMQQDGYAQRICADLRKGRNEGFELKNGLLYRLKDGSERLYVPKALQFDLIRRTHENGHFAVRKTAEAFKKKYWISGLTAKIQRVLDHCVPCILGTEQRGKSDGYLNPINKEGGPLHTWHIDHLGPLTTSEKGYRHLLTIIDAFTKFVWLFPVKSTTTAETIRKLKTVQANFGNPCRIVTDRGTAFTSQGFQQFCKEEKIHQVMVTTGVPRGNGQVERIHQIVKSMVTKMATQSQALWYRHIATVQRLINDSYQRGIGTTPFELMIGVPMKNKEEVALREEVSEAIRETYKRDRDDLRLYARQQIYDLQQENRRNYDSRRKEAHRYAVNDLVAIKRTQFTVEGKFKTPYLGPYRVTAARGIDRYEIEKVGDGEGPRRSTASADHMKPWAAPESLTHPTEETDTEDDDASDNSRIEHNESENHERRESRCAASSDETTLEDCATPATQTIDSSDESRSAHENLNDDQERRTRTRDEDTRPLSGTAELWAQHPYTPPVTRDQQRKARARGKKEGG